MTDNETLRMLRKQVVDDGVPEKDPRFEAMLRVKKIAHCQGLRGVVTCADCSHVEFCSLVQAQAVAARDS